MQAFEAKLQEYRDGIESALESALPAETDDKKIQEAMRYSLLGGGKRIRGVLSLACCEMLGTEYAEALPAACAVEMIHGYSLIHDDLPSMDDDDMRRGKPACHIKYGEATALLAGDGLLTLAFGSLASLHDPNIAVACVRTLSRAAGYQGMIRGQELDLAAEHKNNLTAAEINDIHAHKTGMLIFAAAQMGALVGKASPLQLDAIKAYAKNLGLVFQIVDDVLDVTADEQQLGKPVGSDAEQQKNTYVTLYGIEKSREIARNLTDSSIEALEREFKEKSAFLSDFAKTLTVRVN